MLQLAMRKNAFYWLCLLILATVTAEGAQDSKASKLSSEEVKAIANEIGETYNREYLVPSLGAAVLSTLRHRSARGAYNNLDGVSLAQRLTADLQEVTNDVHSYVKYLPAAVPVGTRTGREEFLGPGVDRVQRLDGNVGYIHVALFTAPKRFAKAADEAMRTLADTRALIIDVRDTPGGSSQSVAYLCSYFFEPGERVHLNSFVYRKAPKLDEWTLSVPAPYLHKAVFVLTSRKTGSGAEGFAYQMQAFGRARIVGERSEGGAHTGEFISVGHGFSVFVPTGYALNPRTNKNWEKTGVLPDIPSEAHVAVEVALKHL